MVTALRDDAGNLRGFAKITRDMTDRKHAEEALRASEERFRAFFHTASVGTAEIALDGRFIEVNERMCQLTGYDRQELLHMSPGDLTHPDDRAREDVHLAAYLRGETPAYHAEKRYRRKDGEVIWVHVAAAMIRDASAHEPRSAGIIQDITERKRAEEALRAHEQRQDAALGASDQRYRTLFDSIDQGFCVVEVRFDAANTPIDYRFLEVKAFERQTGLVNAVGQWMRTLAPTHEEHWFQIYGRIALTGEPARFENRAEALNRWYEVSAFRVGEPQSRQVGILFNDITIRKKEEEARESGRRKDEFLAMLSHELRNPLAPIRNSIYILEHADPASEQSVRARSVIQRQTEHLTRLVDDLLDVTRIARGKIELRRSRVDLRELVWRAADDFGLGMRDRGVAFHTARSPMRSSGPTRTRRE